MEHKYRPRKIVKWCNFSCLRWALILLNIFYILLGLILIGLTIASKSLALFSEPHILIGTALCGSVLVLIAIMGLVGAIKHHQVILFFYMIILGISVLVMFSVSVAALATTRNIQEKFLVNTWNKLSREDQSAIQDTLDCCGFNDDSQNNSAALSEGDKHPNCTTKALKEKGKCCSDSADTSYHGKDTQCPHCQPCYSSWKVAVDRTVRLSGGFGLAFSFTQIFGIILTVRYRNEKDPSINPRTVL